MKLAIHKNLDSRKVSIYGFAVRYMSHEITGQTHGLCSYTEWVFTIYGDLLARVIQTNNSIYSMVSAISITTKTKLPVP